MVMKVEAIGIARLPENHERKWVSAKNVRVAWRAIPLIFEGRKREDGPTRGLAKQYG
jgi:hypothetical protein